MKQRNWIPAKLDVGAFIESGELLSGQTPVVDMERLADSMSSDANAGEMPPVDWQAQGRSVPQRVGGPQLWLHLEASATLAFECQRCLHPVSELVSVERDIRFVADEAAAAELDADSDDDVLALARQFDLLELIEDELIMASPIVPRHDVCPTDVMKHMVSEETESDETDEKNEAESRPNPFAVLAQLKKKGEA